ncbi:MAG: hypothetical protein HQ556_07760 [Candidatus Marinimicrobia bacterium]|nr:hypothetical protein [Candidatus Neomarinimicrobiota bacterium]
MINYIQPIAILLVLFLPSRIFSQNKYHYSPSILEMSLLESFSQQSTEDRELFFNTWHKSISPISSQEYESLNDTIKALYDIFEDIFEPGEIYIDNEYIVLPGEFTIRIMKDERFNSYVRKAEPSSDKEWVEISVNDFRPHVVESKSKLLYLNEKYLSALNYYFSEATGKHRSVPKEVTHLLETKEEFLKENISLIEQHSYSGFRYGTRPWSTNVSFNASLNRALINWSYSNYSLMLNHYVLKNGEWEYDKCLMGGVE